MPSPRLTELILAYNRAPGDAVVHTSVVRDLHRHYRGEIKIDVRTPHREVFENNPYLTPLKHAKKIELSVQPWIKTGKHGLHFLTALHKSLENQTGLECPVYEPKPDLHLTEAEKRPTVEGPYWVVLAGGKANVTIKHWPWARYQAVASGLVERGFRVVQAGAKAPGHAHAALEGVVDLVGRTNLRQLFSLIYNAEGVVCSVTAAMHIAAAFDKRCVVIAGGREEPWWEWYGGYPDAFGTVAAPVKVPHDFLHTLGQLSCCRDRGCWKKLILPKAGEKKICLLPNKTESQPQAECMAMIEPEDVLRAAVPEPMTGQPMDHRIIGGSFTVCVLLYGPHHDLHKRCLQSILDTMPQGRIAELRIGMNQVCLETYDWLERNVMHRCSVSLFDNGPENKMKYPVMREMFHKFPPLTPYTLWFDDDSYTVNPDWLNVLACNIIEGHDKGFRVYGAHFKHTLRTDKEKQWFRDATWYKGRPFQDDSSRETSNGSKIHFVVGGFWACETQLLLDADIPDARLNHNGGDITIGEQIHQAGFKINNFNAKKVHIHTSGSPRRGHSENFPWRTAK